MRIVVVGLGYVGLANALLLASNPNNDVTGVDISEEKIKALNDRVSPLHDNEIEEYLEISPAKWSLQLDAIKSADLVITATPTDYNEDTQFFDTSSIEKVINSVRELNKHVPILIKSTIPIGYVKNLRATLGDENILFSPEFLREGKALYDNLNPSRIIIGEKSKRGEKIAKLFKDCALNNPEILLVHSTEAEAIKLFSNTYLAMRVAFFNELDTYALLKGLDTESIIRGVGLEPRIGNHYNNPSFGYGGYCFPKDTKQLKANYEGIPNDIIGAIVAANKTRKQFIADQVLARKPKVVGIFRLTMKSGSDNFRMSAVQDITDIISSSGVEILIYEPDLDDDNFHGYKVTKSLDDFKNTTDTIIANRYDVALADVADRVYTRDIFFEN